MFEKINATKFQLYLGSILLVGSVLVWFQDTGLDESYFLLWLGSVLSGTLFMIGGFISSKLDLLVERYKNTD